MTGLAVESSELLHHLLLDRAIKIGVVVAALVVLALGMAVIWRRAGRREERSDRADDARPARTGAQDRPRGPIDAVSRPSGTGPAPARSRPGSVRSG